MITNLYKRAVPKEFRDMLHRTGRNAGATASTAFAYLRYPDLWAYSKRLTSLKGAYRGKRCFIMGNGPSLNQMDLRVFEKEMVWGSNRCYLLFDRINWRPAFYTAVDKRVVPDIADEINNLTSSLTATQYFFPTVFRVNSILKSRKDVYWFKEVKQDKDNSPFGMFSKDPGEKVFRVHTVTITALQLAVFFGFNPIYLIGCDTSYSIPKGVIVEGDAAALTSTLDNDTNHFDPTYFGKGRKWNDPKVERMFQHYEAAKQACDSLGVQVYNATVGGKLEVFPRVNYLDLF